MDDRTICVLNQKTDTISEDSGLYLRNEKKKKKRRTKRNNEIRPKYE